jgi:predicted PhzF superfamily epimerase YddE/YHI9
VRNRILIIDAFADQPMTGNPAAVCPLDEWIADERMQAIAAEMNLSETVFFVPLGSDYEIRWFTPTREVDLIGHATLAAGAHILEQLQPGASAVRFLSKGEHLEVRRGSDGGYVIDMPSLIPRPLKNPPAGLAEGLGRCPSEILAAKHYLCVFEDPGDIVLLSPDFPKLGGLELPAVIVTAEGEGGFDFVSRFFAPANGVPEDPVSGVAHCCLAPYWADRLGKSRLSGRQLSRRGGVVRCLVDGGRVHLEGKVAIFLDGWISS